MAVSKRSKRKEYLDEQNAQRTANRGMNAAYTQSHGVLEFQGERDYVTNKKTGKKKDVGGGKWVETKGYTQTKNGLLSVNGKNTKGAKTWTLTEKDDQGNVINQSGRNKLATRSQRAYDIKAGIRKKEIEDAVAQGMGRREASANALAVG